MRDLIRSLTEAKLKVVQSSASPRMVHGSLAPHALERRLLSYPKAHITKPLSSPRAARQAGERWAKQFERTSALSTQGRAIVDYLIFWKPDRKWSAVVSYSANG
jgi:hypothetical protein